MNQMMVAERCVRVVGTLVFTEKSQLRMLAWVTKNNVWSVITENPKFFFKKKKSILFIKNLKLINTTFQETNEKQIKVSRSLRAKVSTFSMGKRYNNIT